jgi:hypothetical protein
MTTKPQIGRNIFNEQIVRGRHVSQEARDALRRLIDEDPGPQTRAMLIAKIALSVGQIEAVLNELDQIGREAKNGSKPKRTLKT